MCDLNYSTEKWNRGKFSKQWLVQSQVPFCRFCKRMYKFWKMWEVCGTFGLLFKHLLLFWISVLVMLIGSELFPVTELLSGIHINHHSKVFWAFTSNTAKGNKRWQTRATFRDTKIMSFGVLFWMCSGQAWRSESIQNVSTRFVVWQQLWSILDFFKSLLSSNP